MTSVGLVACSATKLARPAPARELYSSPLFRMASVVAEAHHDHWLILSAKYGVVHPDEVVAPYNRALSVMDKFDRMAWAGRVDLQLRHGQRAFHLQRGRDHNAPIVPLHGLTDVRLTLYAGEDYIAPLRWHFARNGWVVEEPLAGMQIGERLHHLKALVAAA